ncbi:alpha/beta hydrolase [Litoribacillus peritrichatus]|uniref:Alpha/beta hydrolase n=1 Tax=Litoribacillus peritrichatus TaxID=718191 RepID=A0ABP7MWK8_9GAMM
MGASSMAKTNTIHKLSEPIRQTYQELFSGEVYQCGTAGVSVRNHSGIAKHTVIAVHGFLENHCYFTETYAQSDIELILLTCSNYHIPVTGPEHTHADWFDQPDYPESSIEYDACILIQAMERLATSKNVRIHGHSRGGGVILEAVNQRPDLFKDAEILLEAPVLPQGKIHPMPKALVDNMSPRMWPWALRLLEKTPLITYSQAFFGETQGRKKQLLEHLFKNPQNAMTIIKNIHSIETWMDKTSTDIFKHIRRGTILIPERDRILCKESMLESALSSPNNIRVVETTGTSHFITLDDSSWLPPLTIPLSLQ